MNEPKLLNVGSESQIETTYVSGGTSEASVGTSPQVLGLQTNNNDSNVYLGQQESSASVNTESRVLEKTSDSQTETVKGESGLGQAKVGTFAKTLSNTETSQVGVYVENSNDYSDTSRSLQVSEEQRLGQYVVQTQRLGGFERSKGDKNIVNTITVDEVKALIKKYGGTSDVYTKEEIDHIVETMRKGLYQEVDTTEYPTLEDFLDSDGEEGIIYLYPVGNEGNNYYQYIWETSKEWISLGTTVVDLSQYVTLATDQDITGVKTFINQLDNATGLVKFNYQNGNTYIVGNISNNLGIYYSNLNYPRLTFEGWGIYFHDSIRPKTNAIDIGTSDYKWRDIYLSGAVNKNASSYGLTFPATTDLTANSEIVDTNSTQIISGIKTTKEIRFVNNTSNPTGNILSIRGDNGYNAKITFGSKGIMFTGGGENVGPVTNGGSNLGASTYTWKDLYLSGKIYLAENDGIYVDSSNRLVLQYNGDDRVKIGSGNISFTGRIDPDSNATYDIGRDNSCWKDGYFSGSVYANNTFNVIDATDITNNTLTQAQYDLITNGKPTLIKGTILGITDGFFLPNVDYGGTKYGIVIVGGRLSYIYSYGIFTSRKIFIVPDSDKNIALRSIGNINGKAIPAYPSNTGTFVLKCVDGVLTWVAE